MSDSGKSKFLSVYKHEQLGLSAGIACAWDETSLSFAIIDSGLIEDDRDELQNLTLYGTLTLSIRI